MGNKKINIEGIKRSNIHQVPDGYFDALPLKIQTRINAKKANEYVFKTRMQWASILTAAVVIFIIGVLFYPNQNQLNSVDGLLSEIATEDLIEYLHGENLSTDDILASIDADFLIDELSNTEFGIIDENLTDEEIESLATDFDLTIEI